MSSRPEHLVGLTGSRENAVEVLRQFLLRSNRTTCSVEVWGAAKIGKTEVITAAIEKARNGAKRKYHVLPDDLPQPLSLERIYERVRSWSDQTRSGPRGQGKTGIGTKNPEDLFFDINRILDERTKPDETVLLRILISEVDGTAQELRHVLRNSTGWISGRKIVLEMRRRLPPVRFFPDTSMHGEKVPIVGLHGDEPEKMVCCRLSGHFDDFRVGLVARAARRWCGRHPGLLETFLGRIVDGDFGHRLRAAAAEEIQPMFFDELVDGAPRLKDELMAIVEDLSAEARQQLYEPPRDGSLRLHIDLVESGLTTDDEGRHLALLARRFCQKLRIFISYASEDRETAAELASMLAAVEGLMPIWDHHPGVPPGDEWEGGLLSQIRSCHAFLFVCTPMSLVKLKTSAILRKEVGAAFERRGECLIVPVGQPSMVSDGLQAFQGVDLTLRGGDDALVNRLKQRRGELWRSAAQG